MQISDEIFATIAEEALESLPKKYTSQMQNVAIVYADEPSQAQRQTARLKDNQTLFGLYEGIPLSKRGAGYNLVLPDKITIFKKPLIFASRDINDLKARVRHTLWHEIAHHFGLEHSHIYKLDGTAKTE
jgi:predicted Zn-dependent protease with MMP-like domain